MENATSRFVSTSCDPAALSLYPTFEGMQAEAAEALADRELPPKNPVGLLSPDFDGEPDPDPEICSMVAAQMGFKEPGTAAMAVRLGAVVELNVRAFAEILVESKSVEEALARQMELAGCDTASPEFRELFDFALDAAYKRISDAFHNLRGN